MKKILLVLLLMTCLNVNASSGSIKQSSVIECEGIYYGNHSDHWHVVKKSNNKWIVADSKELGEPSCYTELKNESEIVTLSKCVDGDTAQFKVLSGEVKTARFLAIDTPESVHPTKSVEAYGKEASEYTCSLLTNAKEIKIEYDKASDKEDKYGRILVWVYVDGVMVQESLLETGLAKIAYLYGNYEYTSSLLNIEKTAKDKKLGIWSDYDPSTDSSSISTNMDITEDDDEDSDTKEEKDIYDSIIEQILGSIKKWFRNLINSILDSIFE